MQCTRLGYRTFVFKCHNKRNYVFYQLLKLRILFC